MKFTHQHAFAVVALLAVGYLVGKHMAAKAKPTQQNTTNADDQIGAWNFLGGWSA